MRLKLSFLAVVSTFIAFCAAGKEADKVLTSVFYETYCPDSIKFITKQLYPTFEKLNGTFFTPLMEPFGRTNITTFPNGTVSYTCQHGEKECYGNKVHVCVLSLKKPLASTLKFINCTMARTDPKNPDPNPKYPLDECAIESGIIAQQIKNCLEDSKLVDELTKDYGSQTVKTIPSFPYIAFNNKFDNDLSKKSEEDLVSVLCEKFIASNETGYGEICKSSNNSATTLAFTAFPVILLTFVFSKLY